MHQSQCPESGCALLKKCWPWDGRPAKRARLDSSIESSGRAVLSAVNSPEVARSEKKQAEGGEASMVPAQAEAAQVVRTGLGSLPLEEVVSTLAASVRAAQRVTETSAQPASRQVCKHMVLRMVRAVTPLHTFLEAPQRRAAWCSLPLEVVEVLLGHIELGVDVEETVLEAAILWLDSNLDSLAPGSQAEVATRLLSHIKWGALLPYALESAWRRSRGVRLFDPDRELMDVLLVVHELAAGEEAGLQEGRPCALNSRQILHDFLLVPAGPGLARSTEDVCFHGLLWAPSLKLCPDGSMRLALRCCFPPTLQPPQPAAPLEQPAAAAPASMHKGPTVAVRLWVHFCGQTDCAKAMLPPSVARTCLMAYSGSRSRMEGLFSTSIGPPSVGSREGRPLSWAMLFGSDSLLVREGEGIRVTAAISVLA